MVYVHAYAYNRHTHSPPLPPFFVSLIIQGFAIKLSRSFRTLGAASFSSPSGYAEKQSILLLHSLGGSATARLVQCFALAMKPE